MPYFRPARTVFVDRIDKNGTILWMGVLGRVMPSLDPRKRWFRLELWKLVDDCSACQKETCPEWCREFVSCQMDDLFDEVCALMPQEPDSRV